MTVIDLFNRRAAPSKNPPTSVMGVVPFLIVLASGAFGLGFCIAVALERSDLLFWL